MDGLTLTWWLGAVALVALAIAVMTIRRRREAARLEAKRLLDAADREEREEQERARARRAAMAGEAQRLNPPEHRPPMPLTRAVPVTPRRTSPSGALGRSGRRGNGYRPGSAGYVPGVSDGGGWSGSYDSGSSSGSSDSGGSSCGGGE